jgi:adenylyltransferase/sulfurtransferase
MLDNRHAFRLIDVREPFEVEICGIGGAILIPLDKIQEKNPENLNGIRKDEEIVLHCKGGVRSLKAAKTLKKMGYLNVKSMRGGIGEWSDKVDSSVPKY